MTGTQTLTSSASESSSAAASSWETVREWVQDGRRVVVSTPEGDVVCLSQETYTQLLARAHPQPVIRDVSEHSVPHLTDREREVLRAVRNGGTGPQIAAQMGVAANTIAQHLHSVRTKYGVRTTARALLAAERDGLL